MYLRRNSLIILSRLQTYYICIFLVTYYLANRTTTFLCKPPTTPFMARENGNLLKTQLLVKGDIFNLRSLVKPYEQVCDRVRGIGCTIGESIGFKRTVSSLHILGTHVFNILCAAQLNKIATWLSRLHQKYQSFHG